MWRPELWEEKIQALADEYRIAGLAVALSDREKILWHTACGVTSAEKPWDPVTTQTLFRIASCTKLTVGMLTMQLVEKGLLDLDQPVSTYVPWLRMADESTLDRITLRRLMSHSAGLPSEYTPDGPHDEDRLEAVLREGFASLAPIADPDDHLYYYCNWGIRLVSYILQTILQQPFTALVQKYVLDPLGMDHSTFTLCKAATYSLAAPHKPGPEVLHFIPVNATRHAAGGLFSTVDDMAKLGRVLLNGGAPLIRPSSLQQLMTPETNLYLNYRNDYGLTMRIKQYKTITLCGHDGQSPPYYASIWAVPAAGYCITVTLNTEGGNILSTNRIPELILDDLLELPAQWPQTAPGVFHPEAEQRQAGTYLSDVHGLFSLSLENGRPVLTLDGRPYPLTPHEQPGVYTFRKQAARAAIGLPSANEGADTCVGLPAVNGGPADYLLIDSMLCRKVTPEPLPADADLREYAGTYGTVLDRFTVQVSGRDLLIRRHGSPTDCPCVHVAGETFSCSLGAVIFVRTGSRISGVRIGSSTTFNKV